MRPTAPQSPQRLAGWAPLLVLGLSVSASVVLISTCMAMIGTNGDHPRTGAAALEAHGR